MCGPAMSDQLLLISNGYVAVRGGVSASEPPSLMSLMDKPGVVTIINNFNHYGYMPSIEVVMKLLELSSEDLETFWKGDQKSYWKPETAGVHEVLQNITAENREMGKFVIYQNFPSEVLTMSAAQYWGKQLLMYWGVDKNLLTDAPKERAPMEAIKTLKVLHLADATTLENIWNSLLRSKTRWSEGTSLIAPSQLQQAAFLLERLNVARLDTDTIAFKENAIHLVSHLYQLGTQGQKQLAAVAMGNATDVLRLAAFRSEADVSLRQPVKFKSFHRVERKFYCQLLENTKNLEADFAERPALFKLLLRRLHPGEFACPKVHAAYDALYKGNLRSYASRIEAGLQAKDVAVLQLLAQRPGEFTRRLHKTFDIFGQQAITAFIPLMPRLTTHQLVKLVQYAETINYREHLTFPPKGNWTKLQVKENNKKPLTDEAVKALRDAATLVIRDRLAKQVPTGFDVDEKASWIKLQTNDQELASFGRGTIFEIPDNVTFLRTASYWENNPEQGVTWFDNGWNFFDEKWTGLGSVCWNAESFPMTSDYYRRKKVDAGIAAVFSGDPVNTKELKGRACQMVDLYLDKLRKEGVRYAVWNILCFSNVPFDKATGEVVASLQWGEKPETGKLYEPSRAQLVFPLQGSSLTKYIAYIDLEKRHLVYMDANLKGKTQNAGVNAATLSVQMPAFVEYLETLPSVADLMGHAAKGTTPVLYSDKDVALSDNQPAYVFRPENQNNKFKQLSLSDLLT